MHRFTLLAREQGNPASVHEAPTTATSAPKPPL
jgi:hypothetical protein